MKTPRGFPSYGKVRYSVAFPPEVFERINKYVARTGTPFSVAVTKFCTVSLDKLDALETSKKRIAEHA